MLHAISLGLTFGVSSISVFASLRFCARDEMTDLDKTTGLQSFYEDRFHSNPDSLLDYCFNEIADTASQVGVDWASICNDVTYSVGKGTKYRRKIGATDKKQNGKLMVWGQLYKLDNGKELPQLTFNNNNASIGSSVWSGFSALLEMYERDRGLVSDSKHEEWKKAQAAKSEERARKRAEAERLEALILARAEAERDAYEQAWFRGGAVEFKYLHPRTQTEGTDTVELLGAEDGSAPYLQRKQIGDIAQFVQLKRMRDRHGIFTAVPMFNIDGDFGGLQRIYDRSKYQGTGVKMDGLHCIIGDIEGAKRVYAVEGFATGASVFLAEHSASNAVAVIITFSVGNLRKVIQLYKRRHEKLRIINAADDDQWSRSGNAGRLAALDIHRDFEHWAVLPSFEDLGEEELNKFRLAYEGPTDWNDYHCLFGLKAMAKALRARDSYKSAKDYFEYRLQRISISGLSAEKAALDAIGAGMLLVPIKFSTRQVIDRVLDELPPGFNFSTFKIKRRAVWLAKLKLNEVQELRGFSAAALAKPNVRYLKMPGVVASHGGTVLPDHIADLVESLEGFVIVRAPMGSRKTEGLIAPVMQNSPRAAYIAHRISLLDDAASRLNIQHYQQVTPIEMLDVTHLACCVNSLTKDKFYNRDERSWFTTIDTLCIDEASQVIRHTTTGPVDSPVRVMDALLEAMASAKRVLLCDADANDSVIRLCEEAAPGRPITIIDVTGSMSHITVTHSDTDTVWQKALDLILAGNRVLVANDSAESAKKLAALVLEKRPETKLLLIHRDSKSDPAVDAFLADPCGEAVHYDALIYSPAISSGVSMTNAHFQHHIGIFSGNTIGPSDAVQMLRRDRTARNYLIGIGHTNTQRETDREAIYRGWLAADAISCEFEETTTEILLRRQKTAFDELFLASTSSENRAKNNFANNLLMMLHADSYKVVRMATDELLARASRKNRKLGGQLVFGRRMELIESVQTPTDEQFSKLDRMEVRSEEEAAQMDRYQIEHQLGVSEITPDDVAFYDDRGISKVIALELLQSTEEQARAYDKAQRKARVVLSKTRFKTATRAFLLETFTTLGLDPVTGAGEFSADACREILDRIHTSQESVELYNSLKLGKLAKFGGKRGCATTLVKSILVKIGLGVKNRKSHGRVLYQINPEHWSFMSQYVTNRAAIGVHSLTTHEHSSSAHQPKPGLEAAPAVEGETLQSEGIASDEKYPLDVRNRIYAAARRSFNPLGASIAALVEALAPEVAIGLSRDGADEKQIGFMLAYAQRLHQGAH